jgi:hypothetical protein
MPEDTKRKKSQKVKLATGHALQSGKANTNPITWGFTTDPMIFMDGATQIYKLDTLRFTIFDNGATQYTLQWNATSLGWQSRAYEGAVTPHILIEVVDSGGGAIDTWDVGSPDFLCGAQPVVFTKTNGAAGVINSATGANLSIGGATWGGC